MIFKKKRKGMIDVRELQRRGVVKLPKEEIKIPVNSTISKEGFIDVGSPKSSTLPKKEESNASFFGFMDAQETPVSSPSFSKEQDGYSKREVDSKMVELDNKIYKLEQRVELLEKKLDVGNSTSSSAMGW